MKEYRAEQRGRRRLGQHVTMASDHVDLMVVTIVNAVETGACRNSAIFQRFAAFYALPFTVSNGEFANLSGRPSMKELPNPR